MASRKPTAASQLHRQHLSTLGKTVLKEEASRAPGGNLYEISANRTDANLATKKKTTNFTFGKTAQQRTEEQKKKELQTYQDQVKRVSFTNYTYDEYPAHPLISFFPLLTRKTTAAKFVPVTAKLQLPIPDTFIFLGKDEVKMWLLTSEEGYLEKIESFSNRDMMLAVGRPKGQDNVLTAVMKVKNRRGTANELTLLNTENLKNNIVSPPGGDYIIQRFVQSRGVRPALTRIVWRQGQAATAYTLTSKYLFSDDTESDFRKRFTVCLDVPNSATIFRTTGASIAEPVKLTTEIARYVQRQHGIHMSELVADYIKDAADKWWFIQVKAFRVTPDCLRLYKQVQMARMNGNAGGDDDGGTGSPQKNAMIPRANKQQEYVKLSRCKCCNAMCNPADLVHELTFKMIVQTINHLTHRGQNVPFFNRTDLKVRDQLNMTRVFKVCNYCYDLYTAEKRLISIEHKFASALGIRLVSNDAGEIQIVPPERCTSITPIPSHEAVKKSEKLQLFRFLVFMQSTFNLPIGDYTLAYELGGRTVVCPIVAEKPADSIYTSDSEKLESVSRLNAFRVHFFVADEKSLAAFLTTALPTLRIVVVSGHRQLGGSTRLPTYRDRDAAFSPTTTGRNNPSQSQRMNATGYRTQPLNAAAQTRKSVMGTTSPLRPNAASPSALSQTSPLKNGAADDPTSTSAPAVEEGNPPSAAVAQAFVGEFPIPLSQFNRKLTTNRMDFMVDLEKFDPDAIPGACPQLKATIAFAPCTSEDLSHMKNMPLWPIHSLLFPHLSFFTCEPLPDDWVLLLPQTKAMLTRPMKFFPRSGYDVPSEENPPASAQIATREYSSSDQTPSSPSAAVAAAPADSTPFFTDDTAPLAIFAKQHARLEARKNRGRRPTGVPKAEMPPAEEETKKEEEKKEEGEGEEKKEEEGNVPEGEEEKKEEDGGNANTEQQEEPKAEEEHKEGEEGAQQNGEQENGGGEEPHEEADAAPADGEERKEEGGGEQSGAEAAAGEQGGNEDEYAEVPPEDAQIPLEGQEQEQEQEGDGYEEPGADEPAEEEGGEGGEGGENEQPPDAPPEEEGQQQQQEPQPE